MLPVEAEAPLASDKERKLEMVSSCLLGGKLGLNTKSVRPSSGQAPWSLKNPPPQINLSLSDSFSPAFPREDPGGRIAFARSIVHDTPRVLAPDTLEQDLQRDLVSGDASASYTSEESGEAQMKSPDYVGNDFLFGDLDAAGRQTYADRDGAANFSGRAMPWRSVTPNYQHNLRLNSFRHRGVSSSMRGGLGLWSPPKNIASLRGRREASPNPLQDDSLWLTMSQGSDQFSFSQPAIQTLDENREKNRTSVYVPPLLVDKVKLGASELLVKSPASRPEDWDPQPAEGVSVNQYRTGRQSALNTETSGSWSFRSAESSALETANAATISNIGYLAELGSSCLKKLNPAIMGSSNKLLLTDPGVDVGTSPTESTPNWTMTQSDLASSIEPSNVGNNVMAMWETSDIVGPLSPGRDSFPSELGSATDLMKVWESG